MPLAALLLREKDHMTERQENDMNSEPPKDCAPDDVSRPSEIRRRDFLNVAPLAVAGTGAVLATWPFIDSMNPSAEVLAQSSIEVDLASIEAGQRITVKWRGQPVFIARRTGEEIARAKADDGSSSLIDPQTDAERVQIAEWLIVIGVCTHLGCIPLGQTPGDPRGKYGGWFCPCHGSVYDVSGRVRRGPAPRNLDLPSYVFKDASKVRIG
jgi:ubiquinol-cytochrome c reductase iron-sulfur subunit